MSNRFLLVAQYSSIEPLGVLHLLGLVRDKGWSGDVVLIRGEDYTELYCRVESWKPDIVGFQIWTGNHLGSFGACDHIRALGVPVVIGGPHATYFYDECAKHADWVVKASGFGFLSDILDGQLEHGIHFSREGRKEPFPLPDRDLVYTAYPEYGNSPIKSMFCSVGCPYHCTYCYAPVFNTMHGGFSLTTRPVDDLVEEALAIQKRWPLSLIYFQDDVFGFKIPWLEEFAEKWRSRVNVPFHAQMRLEMTQKEGGERRLDLFKKAGCTGITLAIESGNEFLRDHVLFRHMDDELILEGCRRIMDRGMTLRTEQILGVPFSSRETELQTIDINMRIAPTMPWASILSPYGGTNMGSISSNFGCYKGNNDDLADNFFDNSVLRHIADGPNDIIPIVQAYSGVKRELLLRLRAEEYAPGYARVVDNTEMELGIIRYLDEEANDVYRRDLVRMQRLFNFLPKFPDARELTDTLIRVPDASWTWEHIGALVESHVRARVGFQADVWKEKLAQEMGYTSSRELPLPIAQNPWFFCVMPAGGVLAQEALVKGVFTETPDAVLILDRFGTLGRRHLFTYGLYKIEVGPEPIASFS